jgi:hypothetical protein
MVDTALPDKVDRWRKRRNRAVYGLTKSEPGTPTEPLEEFLAEAASTADRGLLLAAAVSNWHRFQFRIHMRQEAA